MNWNTYVARRGIVPHLWLISRGVTDRESFIQLLSELKIEPPDDEQITLMFPAMQPNTERKIKDESASASTERSDQVATRSVAGEGNGTNQRPDRKRSSKVRS